MGLAKSSANGRAIARNVVHKEGIAHEGVHLSVRLKNKPQTLFFNTEQKIK